MEKILAVSVFGISAGLIGARLQMAYLRARHRCVRLVETTTGTRLLVDFKRMELCFEFEGRAPIGLEMKALRTKIRRVNPYVWEYQDGANRWRVLETSGMYGLERSFKCYELARGIER